MTNDGFCANVCQGGKSVVAVHYNHFVVNRDNRIEERWRLSRDWPIMAARRRSYFPLGRTELSEFVKIIAFFGKGVIYHINTFHSKHLILLSRTLDWGVYNFWVSNEKPQNLPLVVQFDEGEEA